MKRLAALFATTVLTSVTPVVLHSQTQPRQDSSVAIVDSLRPKIIPRHVSPYTVKSSSCHGFTQTKCSLLGALMIGTIGFLAGDVSSPQPTYEQRTDAYLVQQEVCVAHCSVIKPRAIVFSLSGAAIGAIGGWIVGGRYKP